MERSERSTVTIFPEQRRLLDDRVPRPKAIAMLGAKVEELLNEASKLKDQVLSLFDAALPNFSPNETKSTESCLLSNYMYTYSVDTATKPHACHDSWMTACRWSSYGTLCVGSCPVKKTTPPVYVHTVKYDEQGWIWYRKVVYKSRTWLEATWPHSSISRSLKKMRQGSVVDVGLNLTAFRMPNVCLHLKSF